MNSSGLQKFRKKPVVIEAIQFDHNLDDISIAFPDWPLRLSDGNLIIPTMEGDMIASPGDWIIQGVKGEIYPCKPDVFEATYEAVTAGVTA